MCQFAKKERGESLSDGCHLTIHNGGMGNDNDTNGVVVHLHHAVVGVATRWQVWECRARMLLARIANRLGLPGFIKPVVLDDPVTGQHIEIRTGLLFTVIAVDGRDYYFRRFTGTYDGAGIGCSNRSSCCTPAWQPQSTPSLSGRYLRLSRRPNE